MKHIASLCFLLLYLMVPGVCQAQSVEFNLLQSPVNFNLNMQTGALVGIIKAPESGMCLHPMTFMGSSSGVYRYERNDTDRGRRFMQRMEVNLMANQVSLFTSARNMMSLIPIEKRDCTRQACTPIAGLALCAQ